MIDTVYKVNYTFEDATKKFMSKINSYRSMIKIKKRRKSKADRGVVIFDVVLNNMDIDPFLASSVINLTTKFIETCEKTAERFFNQKINWNNTKTIFWIYDD